MLLMRLVLPAPFGPITEKIDPSGTSKSILRSALIPPNRSEISCTCSFTAIKNPSKQNYLVGTENTVQHTVEKKKALLLTITKNSISDNQYCLTKCTKIKARFDYLCG